jgi:hypothetical protein
MPQQQPPPPPDKDPERPAQVVITVPMRLKNAWITTSRAEGKKLTDWIIERLTRPPA